VATSTTNTDQANKPKNSLQPKKQTPRRSSAQRTTHNYTQTKNKTTKHTQQKTAETHKPQPTATKKTQFTRNPKTKSPTHQPCHVAQQAIKRFIANSGIYEMYSFSERLYTAYVSRQREIE